MLVLLYNATGGRKSRYLIDFGGKKERQIHPSNRTSPSLSSPQKHPSSCCLCTTLEQQQDPPPLPVAPSALPSSLLSPSPCQANPWGNDTQGKEEEEQTAVTASPKVSETERTARQKKKTRGGDDWEDDECCAAREFWEETGSFWGLATSAALTSFSRRDGEETGQRKERKGDEGVSQVVWNGGESKSTLETDQNKQQEGSEDGLPPLIQGEDEQRQHNGDVTRPRRTLADKVCQRLEGDRLPESSVDLSRQAFLQLIRRLPVVRRNPYRL